MGLEQYKGDMEMCCRCSACKFIPMQRVKRTSVFERVPQHLEIQFPRLLRRRQTEHRRGDVEERV